MAYPYTTLKDPFEAAVGQMTGRGVPSPYGTPSSTVRPKPDLLSSLVTSARSMPVPVNIPDYTSGANPVSTTPTAPAPTGRVATGGGYATQQNVGDMVAPKPAATAPATSTQTSSTGTSPFQKGEDPFWGQVREGLNDEDLTDLKSYIEMLYSLPKYKGSNEANRAAIALYARQLRQKRKDSGELDQHGLAKIGDAYRSLGDQYSAELAARGIQGPAVAGGLAHLRGDEVSAVGEYEAALVQQRRNELLQERLAQLGFDQQQIQMAMQRFQQDQANKGGFWHDLAGLAGTIGGAVIGGL